MLLLPIKFQELQDTWNNLLWMNAFFNDDLVVTSEDTAAATTDPTTSRSDNETSRRSEEWRSAATTEPVEQAARLDDDRISSVDLLLDNRVTTTSPSSSSPEKWDVLCGRGRGFFEHPGNRRFLSILEPFKDEYQTANKPEKSKIAHRVMMLIVEPAYSEFEEEDTGLISNNGHCTKFWRMNADNASSKVNKTRKKDDAPVLDSSSWVQLDEKEILKKTAHTLREQKTIVRSNVSRSKSPPLLDARKSAPSWRTHALSPNHAARTNEEPNLATKHHPSIRFFPASSGRSSIVLASTTAISLAEPPPVQMQPPLSSFLSQLRSEAPFFARNSHDHQLLDSPLYESPSRRPSVNITSSPNNAMSGSSDVTLLLNQPFLTLSEGDFTDYTSSSYDQLSSPTEYGGNSTS